MPRRKSDSGVTIWDVARESNVSIATVSHVINNGPRIVRPDTRERVLTAIQKLNYHPNAMARGLVRRRMNTIGILSAVFNAHDVMANPYASGILQGVFDGAEADGYDVLMFTQGWQNLRNSGPVYRDRRVDGIVTIAPSHDSDMISGLVSLDLAVTAVAAESIEHGVPSVDVDNRKGARLAVEHLISLGHTRIAHITGNLLFQSTDHRCEGYVNTMTEHGIPVTDGYIAQAAFDGSGGYEKTIELLSRPDPPTAIFAANDWIALGVLAAAREMAISVPERLSVVGFDDMSLTAHITPALTTIRQPLAAIGELAAKLLIERINTGHVEPKMHLLEPDLIVRASTGPPPDEK